MEVKRVKKRKGKRKSLREGEISIEDDLITCVFLFTWKLAKSRENSFEFKQKLHKHTQHIHGLSFSWKKYFLQYSLKIFQPYGKGCACQARHYWIPDNWRNVLIIFLLLYSLIWLEFVFCDGKHRLILGSKKFVF